MGMRDWTFDDIPGVLVYDFDLGVPAQYDLDGSYINAIRSKKNGVVVTNTGTNRPTYTADGMNGKPGMVCAGAQWLKSTQPFTQGKYWMAFAVCKQSAQSGTQNVIDGDNYGGQTYNRVGQYLRFDGQNFQSIAFDPNVNVAAAQINQGSTLGNKILAASLPSRTVQESINGGSLATNTLPNDPIGASAYLMLGSWCGGPTGQPFKGTIGRAIYIVGIGSQDDFDRGVGSLAKGFNMQDQLPATHQYRTVGPMVQTGGRRRVSPIFMG